MDFSYSLSYWIPRASAIAFTWGESQLIVYGECKVFHSGSCYKLSGRNLVCGLYIFYYIVSESEVPRKHRILDCMESRDSFVIRTNVSIKHDIEENLLYCYSVSNVLFEYSDMECLSEYEVGNRLRYMDTQ